MLQPPLRTHLRRPAFLVTSDSSPAVMQQQTQKRRSNAYEEMIDKETQKHELEHNKLVLEIRAVEQKEQIGRPKIELLTRK